MKNGKKRSDGYDEPVTLLAYNFSSVTTGDRFTVMSIDLQPDMNLDGSFGDADAPGLAGDWDRKWLIPAGTNTWHALKIFNDVALPGVYTLAVSGSSNIVASYGGVTVRGGQASAAAFPAGATGETVGVHAEGAGEATLTLSFRGSGALTNYTCETYVDITAWGVAGIGVTSPKLGASPNPPPFPGLTNHVFRPDRSPGTDKHAVVLYKDAVDGSFNVQDFDITLTASLTPAAPPADALTFHWEKVGGPASGQLLPSSSLTAVYRNPNQGGVYRFRITVRKDGNDLSYGEANLVLPLAGAEIDDVVKVDLVRADVFAQEINATVTPERRTKRKFLNAYFYNGNMGDYIGRPDNQSTPAVWYYGQVASSGTSGDNYRWGAVCTWHGRPVRLAKASNFITAYGMRKLGVSYLRAKIAVSWFTTTVDGPTGEQSWDTGWGVAQNNNYDTVIGSLVDFIWNNETSTDKTKQPWPNPNPPDNYVTPFDSQGFKRMIDADRQFTSPGYVYILGN
jgi:hypothetical protein